MNALKKRLTSIIFIFVVTMPFFTAFAQDWSNRVKNNFTVDGKHWVCYQLRTVLWIFQFLKPNYQECLHHDLISNIKSSIYSF